MVSLSGKRPWKRVTEVSKKSQGACVMKISDTYEQIIFVPAICRARPIWRLRLCVPHLRSKFFTNHLHIPGKTYLKEKIIP